MGSLTLFPAIDLMDGRCVRLKLGEPETATVFSEQPDEQALAFQNYGFDHLHIVDLDGAFSGLGANIASIKSILENFKGFIQLGGGIRDMESLEGWLNLGVSRVILGTIAVRDPSFVKTAARKYPGKIAIGLDAKNGHVAISGWIEETQFTAIDIAKRYEDLGISALIYTDIHRDGLLSGPNLEATTQLSQSVDIPVIVSGGMSSIDDVRAVKELTDRGICGAILGRSLYEGNIDPIQALNIVRS